MHVQIAAALLLARGLQLQTCPGLSELSFCIRTAHLLSRLAASLFMRLCPAGLDRVVVAVIDSGVELSSGAVGASLWTNAAEVAADGADNDGNGA